MNLLSSRSITSLSFFGLLWRTRSGTARDAVGGHNTVLCCRSSSGKGRRCTCSDTTDLRQDGLAVCRSIPRPRRCPLRCREISVYDIAKQIDCPARPVGWVAVCRASRAICSPLALRFLNPPTCGGFVTEALFEPICVACCDDRDPSARRRNRREHRWKHHHERTRKRKEKQRSFGVFRSCRLDYNGARETWRSTVCWSPTLR